LLNQIQQRSSATNATGPAGAASPTAQAAAEDPATAALMEALSSLLGGDAAGVPPAMLAEVAKHGDPRLFFQAENQDSFLNAANSVKVGGGDFDAFMQTAKAVKQNGGDLNKFYAAVQNVMNQGDYDDLDRFFRVADVTMESGNSLEKLYQMTSQVLGASKDDYEAVIFAAQSTMMHGGTLADFDKILKNTNFYGFEGRNNLVDFHRVLAASYKGGLDTSEVLRLMGQECEASGDGRAVLNEAMAAFKLRDAGPDFHKFKKIERVDSGPMTITQGESAALFCQCVSVGEGLMPPNYVSWSSEEDGAAGQGNYLDLSKLGPGTYHFVAKVTGGGDTAVKTVIIQPKGDHDNGHGNDVGDFDPSNPGKSKPVERAAYDAGTATTTTGSAGGSATSLVNTVASLFAPAAGAENMNPLLKMFRLWQLNSDNLTANEVYDFIDKQLGTGTSSAFLRSIGANDVAAAYDQRAVTWEQLYTAQIANPQFYDLCTAKFRSAVPADTCASYLKDQTETDPEIAETLWLLGYRNETAAPVEDDHDNGHGNDPGKVDLSNPGKSKFLEKLEKMQASATPIELSDEEIKGLFEQLIDVTKQIEEIDRLIKAYAAFREAKNAEAKREQYRQFWDQLMNFINKFMADQADAAQKSDVDDEPEAEAPKAKAKDADVTVAPPVVTAAPAVTPVAETKAETPPPATANGSGNNGGGASATGNANASANGNANGNGHSKVDPR
jgi:hypothetical protein